MRSTVFQLKCIVFAVTIVLINRSIILIIDYLINRLKSTIVTCVCGGVIDQYVTLLCGMPIAARNAAVVNDY